MYKFFKILCLNSLLTFILFNLDYFKFTNIFFYDGLIILLLSFLISLVFIKKNTLSIYTLVITFLLHTCVYLLIPVSLERSISVELLENLQGNKNETISFVHLKEEIKKITNSEKFISKRIEEQIATGNFKLNGEEIVLTSKYKIFIKLDMFFRKIYGLDQ